MRKKLPLLPILLLAFISCKKSNSSGTGTTLSGSWNLIDIVAHTSVAVDQFSGSDDYKDVTISDYTTTNNGGTMAFSGGVATSTGITYEASFIALDSSYLDGQLIGTISVPDAVTLPAPSSAPKS